MKKSILFLSVFALFFVFQSCEDPLTSGPNDNPDNLAAPQIPPLEMLTLPTTEVEGLESNAADHESRFDTYENWGHAVLSLIGWNTIVVINLAVPTAAVGQAFNQNAQYIGNNTFEWSYVYSAPQNLGGKSYNISLTAEYINTTEIEWKLVGSEVGGFTNFLWYSAVIANDHSYANFTLNRNPQNPEPYIGISYIRDFASEDVSLRFTNLSSNGQGNGDFIEYRVSPKSTYNRAFDVKTGVDNILNVEWDAPSNEGRVKHPDFFGDRAWHCWDTGVADIDC